MEKLNVEELFETDSHDFRYELQYIFIPRLVDAVNNEELDSSLLY